MASTDVQKRTTVADAGSIGSLQERVGAIVQEAVRLYGTDARRVTEHITNAFSKLSETERAELDRAVRDAEALGYPPQGSTEGH